VNKNLEHLLVLYATKSREEVRFALADLSRESLEATLIDLLTLYLNDANSSTVREWITLHIAGYQPIEGKLGYNGYRMTAPASETERKQFCEVKPVNTHHRADGTLSRRLNGGGSFSDYTPERLEKDLGKSDLQMLVSGFVDGHLVYILEFPFSCLERRLRALLKKRFPSGQRKANEYLRGASFTFRDYKECDKVRLLHLTEPIAHWEDALTREFRNYLVELKNKESPNA